MLKNLTDDEMIEASGAFLAKDRKRPLLERLPLLAAMLPSLEAAHEGLLASDGAPADDGHDAERARLYKEGVATDARHDRKGGGVFHLLTALSMLTDDADDAAALLALRRRLFPDDNLMVLKASWRGEAGNALRITTKVLVDREVTGALKAIPLGARRTLLDSVREFTEAGARLGEIEDQRDALQKAAVAQSEPAAPSRMSLRNRWVSVVGTMVQLVDDVLRLEGSARDQLLGALEAVEAKADARVLARRSSATMPQNGAAGEPKGDPEERAPSPAGDA